MTRTPSRHVLALDPTALQRLASANRPTWSLAHADDTRDALYIYGVIGSFWGDVAASDVVPAIRASTAPNLDVYVNSPGGDVYDGIAIRNALRQSPANVTVHVDGLAASAASFIAMAGSELVMGANSELMIHDAWTIVLGNEDELQAAAADIGRISDNIAAMYAEKAGGDPADWRAVMKAETWYSADEAVAAGLADRTDSDAAESAAASFDLSVFAHAGRTHAPAPLTRASFAPAALAPIREDNTMNRAQLAAALAAGTITQEEHDAALATIVAIENAATPEQRGREVAAEVIAGPELPAEQPRAVVVAERMTVRQVAERLATAHNEAPRHNISPFRAIQNELADIIPADDDGQAFLGREDWIGEVWRASDDARIYIDAIGVPQPLTSLERRGWRWGKDAATEGDPELPGTPDVDEYEGNKTEVPTNEIGTKRVDFDSFMIAAGWDIERRFFDFGSPEFWTSFMAAATSNYRRKSDDGIRTRVLAEASAPAAGTNVGTLTAKGASALLKQLRADIRATAGGHANRLMVGSAIFDAIEDLDSAHLPLWLKNAEVGQGFEEGTATAGQLRVQLDPKLPAGGSVAFDSRAFVVREKSPFWLEALNIGRGGVDVGVHSYLSLETHDERVVVKRTYTV